MTVNTHDFIGDWAIKRGSTWSKSVTYAGVDLSLYASAKMQIRKAEGTTLIAEFSTDNGRIQLNSNGVIDILAESDYTATIPKGFYQYDLELTDAGGEVTALLEGSIEVKPNITE